MGGLQIRFMFALTEWGPGAATHTPEGGEAFKETPRKAILSLFFFEMRHSKKILWPLHVNSQISWVDKSDCG